MRFVLQVGFLEIHHTLKSNLNETEEFFKNISERLSVNNSFLNKKVVKSLFFMLKFRLRAINYCFKACTKFWLFDVKLNFVTEWLV